MDEGTAIFKQLRVNEVPADSFSGMSYWVSYSSSGSYSMSASKPSGDFVWSELATNLRVTFQGIDNDKGSDWYLWLTGQARKMFRGETPVTKEIPAR